MMMVLAVALMTSAAWAQEPAKKPSWADFKTNGFWDNWEVSAGVGVSTVFSNNSPASKAAFEGSVSVTKWVHPVVGVRGMLQGSKYTTKVGRGDVKWPMMSAHVDAMVNVSNWIGGYREDRVYYAVPYLGMGFTATNFTDDSQAETKAGTGKGFSMHGGLLNKFRVSKAVDIDLEIKGMLAPSRIAPVTYPGKYLFAFGATVGATYRFNKRNWERPVAKAVAVNPDEIRAYQNAVADGKAALDAAKAENARLAKDLQAARDAAAAAKAEAAAAKAAAAKAQEPVLDPSTAIIYSIGSTKLTSVEKLRLDMMADKIKAGSKDQVYTIEGHADAATGTAAVNKRIAEARAKTVYDYLISKGVNPSQLTYEGKGDSHNPYKNPVANRVAIIK